MFAFAAFVLAAVGQELWRGVRARRAMSRDSVPARAARAGAAQPAPLRRLHRPRRHRGAVRRRRGVVGVPDAAAGRAAARPDRADRAATRSPTSARRRGSWRRSNGRLERIDLGARLQVRRGDGAAADARHVQVLLPEHGPEPRPGLALLRGRGDQRGRPARRAAARPLDRGRARHRPPAPRIEEGDKVFADATRAVRRRSAARSSREALRGLSRSYTDRRRRRPSG